MWPIQTALLLLALCAYGTLSLTWRKRSIVDPSENPSDLHEALRVLEREGRRFELHAAEEALPREGIQFQEQPVIIDSQDEVDNEVDDEDVGGAADGDDDAGNLNEAVSNNRNLVYYGPEEASDVESLMREIGDPGELSRDSNRRLNLLERSAAKEEELAEKKRFSLGSESDYKRLYNKYAKKMVKQNNNIMEPWNSETVESPAPQNSDAVESPFNNLTPEEIERLILLAGHLQNEKLEKQHSMDDLAAVKKQDRKRGKFEDADDDTTALSQAELQDLIQNNAMSDGYSDSAAESNYRKRQLGRQMEKEQPDNLIVNDPSNNDLMEMSISDLAKLDRLQRLQKQFMNEAADDNVNADIKSFGDQDENKDERYMEKDAVVGNRWVPRTSIAEDLIPASDSLQDEEEDDDDDDESTETQSLDFTAENQQIASPDIAEIIAKLWIKHKLEGMEIDYLTDALKAATISQSTQDAVESIPREVTDLQKAIKVEKLMEELEGQDIDTDTEEALDQLALEYLRRFDKRSNDIKSSVNKRSWPNMKLAVNNFENNNKDSDYSINQDTYQNNLRNSESFRENAQLPLMYEIPDNRLQMLQDNRPNIPSTDITEKMQYPMNIDANPRMDNLADNGISLTENTLSNEGDNVEEEEDADDADDDIDNEDEEEEMLANDFARFENAKKQQELSELAALNAEENRQQQAALNFQLMLQELDKEKKLRNRLLEEEEEEEEEAEEEAEEEEEEERQQEEEKACPVLSMAGNCQFADMLKIPFTPLTRDLCKRHAMCYNCGLTMRLGPTICDRGFLADAMKSCDNSLECMQKANVFLSLMKVAHKYNSTPNRLCDQSCVRDYVIGL